MESCLWREEKYQTWSSPIFPFGGFSHAACQVMGHGSPLESPLPPLLVLGSSGLCLPLLTADVYYLGGRRGMWQCQIPFVDIALCTSVSLVNYLVLFFPMQLN